MAQFPSGLVMVSAHQLPHEVLVTPTVGATYTIEETSHGLWLGAKRPKGLKNVTHASKEPLHNIHMSGSYEGYYKGYFTQLRFKVTRPMVIVAALGVN